MSLYQCGAGRSSPGKRSGVTAEVGWELQYLHSVPGQGPLQRMQVHAQGKGKLEIQLSIDLTVDVVYFSSFVCWT